MMSPSSSTEPAEELFRPFISSQDRIPEFTLKAVLVGILFAVFFGVSSVYLALCAGFPITGSIPISVMAIGVLKRLGKSTVLENNLIQTIGSSGESIASGVVFTTIAFLFLPEGVRYFHYFQIVTIALIGGLFGMLFMLPLRQTLIVKEHNTLKYPEGTACAEVLMAGEKERHLARPVFIGSLIAAVYWGFMRLLGLWKEVPYLLHRAAQSFYPNATFAVNVTPEYLGLGYIIGPRVTFQILAGSAFAWLVLVPLLSSFPQIAQWLQAQDVYTTLGNLGITIDNPNGFPTASQIHAAHVKYIGVGAVVGAGFMTLLKTLPIIIGSIRSVFDAVKSRANKREGRTEKELPLRLVLLGIGILFLLLVFLPHLPGTFPGSLLTAFLIVLFGFFFVTVASRFVGAAGYSIEPTSSMMFTTVMATCLVFILLRWTIPSYQVVVVFVGAIVCVAANNAGATSQDLKTGFLLGATPYKQQLGLLLGIVISSFVVGTAIFVIDHSIPQVPHAIGYVMPGQEGPKYGAPQATLLAMLIKAVLGGKMPWGLVLLGAGLAIVLELSGALAISIAAGIYLPISVSTALAIGSLVRWLATGAQMPFFSKAKKHTPSSTSELSKGMLYATGLVAGGAFSGLLLGFLNGFFPKVTGHFDLGHEYWKSIEPWGDYLAVVIFCLLGVTIYRYAQKDKLLGSRG